LTGILIVSHSRKVAEGAKEMALAMTGGEVEIIAAGGTADGGLGTDYEAIFAGMSKLALGGGGVVLMDLGSAVMSVKAALEQMGDAAANIVLLDAPLIEGAVVVAVQASLGSGPQELKEVAQGAWGMRKLI